MEEVLEKTENLQLGDDGGSFGFTKTEFRQVKEMEEMFKIDCKYVPPTKTRKDPEECKANFVRVMFDGKYRLGAIVKALKSSKTFTLILLQLETESKDDETWQLHNIDRCELNDILGQELIGKINMLRNTKEPDYDWYVTCKLYAGQKIKMTIQGKVIPVEMEYITIT